MLTPEQAKRDFINAKLRPESGASIADPEYANVDKQYFPQWGDTREVIAQKRRNREAAIFGTSRAAGQNYEQPQIRQPQQGDDGWVSMGGDVRIRRKQP